MAWESNDPKQKLALPIYLGMIVVGGSMALIGAAMMLPHVIVELIF